MKKRLLVIIMTVFTFATVLAGCSSNQKTDATASDSGAPVEITFWHAMGGAGGEAINKMVENFNNSQKKVHVTAQFQGTYDEAINKLKSAAKGNAGPDVMQVYDIGTRFMIDSGYAVPMQKLIDEQKFDTSSLEPNLLAYYTVDKKLYSMPFNSSTPILYYNKTAFKEAGLDPEKAPKTFDELIDDSNKLTKKNGDKVERNGLGIASYSWLFEQFLVKQGANYANNGNGRTGKATQVEFDTNGAGQKVFDSWKKLYDSGAAVNLGRKTDDTKSAFIAGKVAMTMDSTASLKDIMKGVGDRFEIGTAYLPTVDPAKNNGVSIGGASLWVMDKKDPAKEKAAFEFIKYMVSPEQQAFWSQNTGYFPVTKKAYDLQDMKDYLQKYPQFQTAINQLHDSPKTSTGALLGVFPEARQTVEQNLEKMIKGDSSPTQAMQDSAKTINAAITNYNKANVK
ncbi:ABC transporter substrate-binding protein [Ectobacillus polymachus]|uniref:ABC transporter substrate-binding protein n=1 Tax=Ectobacillus polymachus TaxID=1508806 RepID=UPI003A891E64